MGILIFIILIIFLGFISNYDRVKFQIYDEIFNACIVIQLTSSFLSYEYVVSILKTAHFYYKTHYTCIFKVPLYNVFSKIYS